MSADQIILVTGANGFVSGQVIKSLLEAGYSVRGAVRSQSSAQKVLDAFPSHAGSRVTTAIVPDITKHESYSDGAFAGNVTGVVHTASPFALQVDDNKRDLLDPAMHGAVAVLEGAHRYSDGSVKRVVTISSFAGIVDLGQGTRKGHTYTAAEWNPMTYDEAAVASGAEAYCASKSLAERAQLDWMESNKPGFDMVSLNPAWVFGPHYPQLKTAKHLNESTHKLYEHLGAKELYGFDFGGFVDSRVLAAASAAALQKKEAGGERYLLATHFDWQMARDGAVELVPELESRLPKGTPGKHLVDDVYAIDGSKAQKELGIEYISLKQSMADSYRELLEGEKLDAAA